MTSEIASYLGHEPTEGQRKFFGLFDQFIRDREEMRLFILRGYAGTGKTSTMKALVKILPKYKIKTVLLAPTGRAAKVLSGYTGKQAFTIHKKIYRKKSAMDLHSGFSLAENKHQDTIFIVDESSMISGNTQGSEWSRNSLLEDLIRYVYEGTQNCKILFIGDTAQLPPVGSEISPALDKKMMERHFNMKVYLHELKEVMRQEKSSGILYNATALRDLIETGNDSIPSFITAGFKDFYALTGEKLGDGIQYAFDKYGMEETLVICRSNKNANAYNQQIRNRILYREEEISGGDYLMIVKNNYLWIPEEDGQGFIANGEIARVIKLRREEEVHGFKFAEATLKLIDSPGEPVITAQILIDTLYSETPALSADDQKKLYEAVNADYADIIDKKERMAKIKSDPYFNALQIKFAYAVTCHKAQGGQWKAIFIDQGYMKDEMLNTEFLRWLYTAITRGTQEVFLVNFHPKFFKHSASS